MASAPHPAWPFRRAGSALREEFHEDVDDLAAVFGGPVLGEFGKELVGGGDGGAGLVHAADGNVVGDLGGGAAGVGDDLDLVAGGEGGEGGVDGADVIGDAGDDEVGAAGGLDGGGEVFVVEGVDDALALDAGGELLGRDVLQL
ncbi:hypothetical protein OG949_00780 [Streptomyces scopuliridis]|nr:hypothetical protein [Streptomyces scopuliridis]WSB31558.1 hypothetical protein OG949_00780 [Streptomyces scopuliridis]